MKKSPYVRFFNHVARLFFPRCEVVYEEENDEPGVYLCNHSGAIGPSLMTLYFKKRHKSWMIANVLDKGKNAYFFSHDAFFIRARKCKAFWKAVAAITVKTIRPLLMAQEPIPVYHDGRMKETFRKSEDALQNGWNLVIFPESPKRYSEYVNNTYEGFADLGRTYYKDTGKKLKFYPVYAEKKNRKILVGKPTEYDPTVPPKTERKRIGLFIRDGIDRLARSLPPHKPTPFLPPIWYEYYGEYENDPLSYWKIFETTKE